MPAETPLARLRSCDPARSLEPMGAKRREELRSRIVSAPLELPRPRRRAIVVAIAAALAALALTAAGYALYQGVFSTPAQVRDDFAVWTKRIPLPPGAAWRRPNLDGGGLYGARAAEMIATGQAICAWFSYWERAAAARNDAQLRVAAAGIGRVRAMLPLHPAGAGEEAGGYTRQSLSFYDRIIRRQKAGDPRGTRLYLRANCS